jgi:hypothetical protein
VTFGEVHLTQHYDPETGHYSITVNRADPVVLISQPLLTALTTPHTDHIPAWQRNAILEPGNGPGLYGGCILRIRAVNRALVYRITGRHDEYTWIGEWPD